MSKYTWGTPGQLEEAIASGRMNNEILAAYPGLSVFSESGRIYGALAEIVSSTPTDSVNVRSFGAKGDGVTDDSTAIQAAINTGKHVDFVGGTYAAHGLTVSVNGQCLFSTGGVAHITKNANGPIVTCAGTENQIINLEFRGESPTPSFTGDNVVATGNNFAMLNSASVYAFGRAVKATGDHTQILGTCNKYFTTDATATGYDIEIGSSGTATLYHVLDGVYTSQNTGGILLVDTGSHHLQSGQFGKLYIKKGTGPAGVNGGITSGCRILGVITVEASSAVFSGNQFGASANIVFAAGTSGCLIDESNVFSGGTVTNNGNANNFVQRNVSAGSTTDIKYGADSSIAVFKVTESSGQEEFPGIILLQNNTGVLRHKDSGGNAGAQIAQTVADNWSFSNPTQNKAHQYQQAGASGLFQWLVNSVQQMQLTVSQLLLTVSVAATRFIGTGTSHVAGDYAASAGWGTTPTITPTARDSGGRVSVLAQATTGANPTLALTFKDGTWTTAPAVSYGRGDSAAPTTCFWALTTITATVATWTFVGTPTAGSTYILDFTVMGK